MFQIYLSMIMEIITQKQTDFYNEILFPNFDDLDDFGSLIDKGQKEFLVNVWIKKYQ